MKDDFLKALKETEKISFGGLEGPAGVLIGPTGAGKTTFSLALQGYQLNAFRDNGVDIKLDCPNAQIGHGHVSATFKPDLILPS